MILTAAVASLLGCGVAGLTPGCIGRFDTPPETLAEELRYAMSVAECTWPVTRQNLIQHYEFRSLETTASNGNLDSPPWATQVSGDKDVFFKLNTSLLGVQVPEQATFRDPELILYPRDANFSDVAKVLGPLREGVRIHWDSPYGYLSYPEIDGHELYTVITREFCAKRLNIAIFFEKK